MHHTEQMTPEMQRCVDTCMECHAMCEETLNRCMSDLGKDMGRSADGRLMRLLMDCAEVSRMCADMMMRGSEMSMQMCQMCAQVCEMCAEACRAMGDDEMMMRCAEACARCAESCRAMSGAASATVAAGMSGAATA